ncbi:MULTISPECIES: HDOD domain-containing protein [Halomonadaceae]|uniref:HDOD domain-containing protein n=1 Tax=Vreelandella halophila TaxID=86177 RepID=A0A9X4YDI1_9GAMM|nr:MULTISPECIES: HDOD domain-containing protein [Halomonas]MYL27654.1 HDOD domain-containing protein [Halomonas utahensis]MYL75384.1 HDOD domain-containing protein [Halomonas sp. 22501_18_FS]
MPAELTDEQIHNVLQGIRIPPQPQIMVDLQMEQAMPDPDIEQIAKLIRQDVSLSGMMLKFVNSPFLQHSNQISSIEQAVALLGPTTVINIINGLSIKGEMSDQAIRAMTRFWDTATDIAQVSAHVARAIGAKNPDESYAIGLFHNAGIPLMMERFPDYDDVMMESYARDEPRLIDVENRMLNTNHAVVGYYVAKSWNLPRHLCEVIAEHHNVQQVFAQTGTRAQERKTLLATLKIAEHICGNFSILGQQEEDYEWQRLEQDVLIHTGLTQYDLEEMAQNFRDMGITVHGGY